MDKLWFSPLLWHEYFVDYDPVEEADQCDWVGGASIKSPLFYPCCTSTVPAPVPTAVVSQKYFISGYIHSIHSNAGSSFFLRIYFTRIWKRAISTAIITAAKERFPHWFSLYCWFARYVTAAMLVVKNKSISLLWELNSIFIFSIFYFH